LRGLDDYKGQRHDDDASKKSHRMKSIPRFQRKKTTVDNLRLCCVVYLQRPQRFLHAREPHLQLRLVHVYEGNKKMFTRHDDC
jgi:hypothetical protein